MAAPAPTIDKRALELKRKKQRGKGLAIAGVSVLASAYVLQSFVGSLLLDGADSARERAYGRRMLIPVVGPFAAYPVAPSYTAGWFTTLLGGAQLAGIAMSVAGLVKYRKAKRQIAAGYAALPGGGGLTLRARF